ncbi:MAG: NAD(P)/FAD-dependent oxidoreductase, partial [Candidatus Izemoplasmatales bacterium]|nr:NAD(P)/FAD-dependent oxidoreductase [Candidatus Izemoplasmatales bacterium]
MKQSDVLIIGAGVIGCMTARELSAYDFSITVLEKNSDVCEETSKANSGIVHSGVDAKVGTQKAKYNLLGNQMMKQTCEDLEVAFVQNGTLILAFFEHDLVELERLRQQGIQNGVPHLQILPRDKVLEMEPNLNPDVYAALYAPTGGIVDPFQLTIASAEVASLNGVKFEFQTTVTKVVRNDQGFEVMTDKGSFFAKILVNAAGTFSDDVHNFLSAKKLTIRPRKGEYCLFDKQVGQFVHSTIFQLPTSAGKGVLVTPTAEGNLLIGPSSVFIDDKEDKETTIEGIRYVMETAKTSVPNLPMREIITGFAGLRAAEVNGDFILGEAEDVPNLYNAAGIESP